MRCAWWLPGGGSGGGVIKGPAIWGGMGASCSAGSVEATYLQGQEAWSGHLSGGLATSGTGV